MASPERSRDSNLLTPKPFVVGRFVARNKEHGTCIQMFFPPFLNRSGGEPDIPLPILLVGGLVN